MSAPGRAGAADMVVEHVACLGCGLTCDDITVVARDGRIVETRRACPLGRAWFGDGVVPSQVTVGGGAVSLDEALDAATRLLAGAERPLVYLAPELSTEAQRGGVAIADAARALLDAPTSDTVLPAILAAQRRGRASATLGELRNRGDVIVFWGVDPAVAHPRFAARVAPDPVGTQLPRGRADRTVVAVDVGERRGPADADLRLAVDAADEAGAIARLRAAIAGPGTPAPDAGRAPDDVAALAGRLTTARYVGLVYDGEPAGDEQPRDDGRADALLALAIALNGPTRAALVALRAGGNRAGAEVVATSQTGYPATVDFARGWPRYRPYDPARALLARGEIDAALVLGAYAGLPTAVARALAGVPCVVVGPRASEGAPRAAIVIDTGVAGIHEGGTAVRLDDVPLPLRPALGAPHSAADVAGALAERVWRARAGARASARAGARA